jgi:hypothetical protein
MVLAEKKGANIDDMPTPLGKPVLEETEAGYPRPSPLDSRFLIDRNGILRWIHSEIMPLTWRRRWHCWRS